MERVSRAIFLRTTLHELGLDGEAMRGFEMPGPSYQWLKLR